MLVAFYWLLIGIGLCLAVNAFERLKSRCRTATALVGSLVDEKDDLRRSTVGTAAALSIAKIGLTDIRDQNQQDHYFTLWAKKRASDTLDLMERC